MTTLHEKSPCCRAGVARFGGRRRQCTRCKRTWSVWKRRRGRKRRRYPARLLARTFREHQTLTEQARQRGIPAANLHYRFRTLLSTIAASPPGVTVPRGPQILLLDGLWFRFLRKDWVLYLVAVRPVHGSIATFLDPVLLSGKESLEGWRVALRRIPGYLRSRIVALVSDGFRGSHRLAEEYRWVPQRCHFHLIARLQAVRGHRKRLPEGTMRETIYHLVRQALVEPSARRLATLTQHLRHLTRYPACPEKLGGIVREFLRDLPEFHAYLRHPELNLPTTTNTVEAMGKLIRRATRTISTPHALAQWATAFVRLHPTITCNGSLSLKINRNNLG